MKTIQLMLPLFAVTLGACSTYTPMTDGDQHTALGQKVSGKAQAEKPLTSLAVEPMTRITNGVSDDRAAYLMGKSLLAEHKTDAAIDSFAKALSINAKMVDAYVGIGIAQSMANRQPLAIAAFDEAVRLEPSSAQWRANLGMAFARNGDFQKASTELSKAWAMAPSNKRIEAQYQRVAETARLERVVAEQAAARQASIDASGMTIITGDDTGGGMRQVNNRVYELDLEPKLAAPANMDKMNQPMVAALQAPAASSLPPLVSVASAEPMAEAKESEPTLAATVESEAVEMAEVKLPAPMLPPAMQITQTTETVEKVVTTAPVKIKPITMSAEKVQVTDMPMSLSAEQVAKAEAEITRTEEPVLATSMSTPTEKMAVEMSVAKVEAETEQQPAAENAILSREQALELARKRLFERKLARARIRAARTAMIGLEDQASSGITENSSIQR